MKVLIGLVLALAVLVCVAQASDVVVLTNDNFDEVIKSNDYVLVEFFVRYSVCDNPISELTDIPVPLTPAEG